MNKFERELKSLQQRMKAIQEELLDSHDIKERNALLVAENKKSAWNNDRSSDYCVACNNDRSRCKCYPTVFLAFWASQMDSEFGGVFSTREAAQTKADEMYK